MSLADLAEKAQSDDKEIPWRTCQVCHLLTIVDKAYADKLDAVMRCKLVRYSEIADNLAEDGHAVGRDALSRHCRGQCSAKVHLR